MEALLSKSLRRTKDLTEVDLERLKDSPLIGLYFTASFCGPCKKFSSMLKLFYEEINADKVNFEVIVVPSDHDEAAYKAYVADMPWLSVPFGDLKIKELQGKFKINGIPALIVVDNKGNLISKEGRKEVSVKGEEAYNEWLENIPK